MLWLVSSPSTICCKKQVKIGLSWMSALSWYVLEVLAMNDRFWKDTFVMHSSNSSWTFIILSNSVNILYIFCTYRIFRKAIPILLNRSRIFQNPLPILVKGIRIFLKTGYSLSLFLFLWTLHSTNALSPWEMFSEHFHGWLKACHWSACSDVMPRPGWCQVLLYKGTETAEQLMCTAQLVQAPPVPNF